MSGDKGFTLLELAVTMAIMVILLLAGTPPMQNLLLDSRRARVTNELLRALHVARAESVRTSADVVLCPVDEADGCSRDTNAWSLGWMVFVNADRDDPPTRDAHERLLLRFQSETPGTVTANRSSFVYRPFGRRSTAGTLVYCDVRGSSAARAVIVSHTGRPRVSAATPAGSPLVCPG